MCTQPLKLISHYLLNKVRQLHINLQKKKWNVALINVNSVNIQKEKNKMLIIILLNYIKKNETTYPCCISTKKEMKR